MPVSDKTAVWASINPDDPLMQLSLPGVKPVHFYRKYSFINCPLIWQPLSMACFWISVLIYGPSFLKKIILKILSYISCDKSFSYYTNVSYLDLKGQWVELLYTSFYSTSHIFYYGKSYEFCTFRTRFQVTPILNDTPCCKNLDLCRCHRLYMILPTLSGCGACWHGTVCVQSLPCHITLSHYLTASRINL